ncbi:MAG TPA: TonB-dependent receptor [Steroidobacteraceae bacterium]|nr:TonB-dependent receptor [Steroidobacteraceae bacterium]
MHRSRRVSPLVPLVLAPVAAIPAAQADQAAGPQPAATALQEIVVTAQKRAEKLHDVPMGVTAITTDELDRQQIVSLEDLQSKVPGLSLTQTEPGITRLTLRGQNVGGVGSTVTTYVDDTPFGSSNALANGFGFSGDFDTWDLQRIEVLRGPQGTLYGAGSEGGLLKYVTNPPDPTKFAAAVQAGGEDVSHGESAGSAKGMINLPLGDRGAFRLSGYSAALPGYIDDPSLGAKDINHGHRDGVRAALLINFTDDLSLRLNAVEQELHTDGTAYTDVVGATNLQLTPPANQLQPQNGDLNQQRFINEPNTFKYGIYSATLNWNVGWGTLTYITSYGTTDENGLSDVTSSPAAPGTGPTGTFGNVVTTLLPFVSPVPPAGVTSVAGLAETEVIDIKKWTQEFRLASAAGQTLEWQVGAFYTRESSALDQTLPLFYIPTQVFAPLTPALGGPSLENASLDARYREWAGFAQFTYHFNPQWDLALGGRYSENKQSASELLTGVLPTLQGTPQVLTSGDSSDNDFTYSIAPRWHVSSDTMVYGRIATGYRPGGPNDLPLNAPPSVPRAYQPDETTNYEAGVRSDLLDRRLSVDVAAFLVDWKKIQLFEFLQVAGTPGFGINANGGTARSKGLEWTLGLTPATGLTFTLTGAYVDAYLTSPAPAAGGRDGDLLPFVPKWSTSLDGDYRWRAFDDFNAFVGATWSYIGSRLPGFGAIQDATGTFQPEPRPELPSYNSVNLRAGVENGRWAFELYCKNAGDTRGITDYGNGGSPNYGGGVVYVVPRTLGATATLRF